MKLEGAFPKGTRVYTLAILTIFPIGVILAAATDLFSMTIPNRISLALMIGFYCVAPFSGLSLQDIGMHTLAGVLVLCLGIGLFSLNFIGGGDAKLAAAVALWMGLGDDLLEYAVATSLLGGGLSLLFLTFRQVPLPYKWAETEWIARLHAPRGAIPYGIALSAGALIVYHQSFWLRSIHG